MSNGSEKRRFQIGDIVRFKPGYRTPQSFNIAFDEVGTVFEIEPHPPQTGPTYRISVLFPHGLVEGVFEHEFEVTDAPSARKPINERGIRDLFLTTIAGHPVCPPGFEVDIKSLGGGAWEVLSIPPAGGPAYADCVDYISQIAKVVRLNYYLQVLGSIQIEAQGEVTPPDPVPAPDPVPKQGPGPRFRVNEEGLIDRAPPADIDAIGNDIKTINQLKPLVLSCASELETHLPRNQFPELLTAVQHYAAALNPGENRSVEWGEVWGLGVILQNTALSAERKITDRIFPPLEDPAKSALDSLLRMHGPMILATADGARLTEMAARFSMTKQLQEELGVIFFELGQELETNHQIITPRAAASVTEAAEAIGKGSHPERGTIYSLATVRNISIVLIGAAAIATPTLIGALIGGPAGALAGAGVSLVVGEAVKKNPTFISLVTQIGDKLENLPDTQLLPWLEERARRLAPLRSFVLTNTDSLRKIADTTPELRWINRYIDFIVGEPELIGEAAVLDVTGNYVRFNPGSSSAEITVEAVSSEGDIYSVRGEAYYGIDRAGGPNTGELDFSAPLVNNSLHFSRPNEGSTYKITLTFSRSGMIVKEENASGIYGLNVRFEGEYYAVTSPDSPPVREY